ncbi:MAG: hypothetical protein Q9226_001705 [Calogaya cf. arnoldii]
MPELWCLLIQHEGESVEQLDEKEKRALDHGLIEQPKLTTFVFWMKNVDPTPYQPMPYRLTKEDAALFRQPTVERFRLS